ncbi:hypothetical protein CTA1_13015 [Colletotrichum tanaceti]|uniref:Uncharacterized protein n=1 Tax=Colletotrichum tanaceti TaxID=1306861 RepID=A0A4U6X753_9PEZI|nr:hypothetical protein CTA1_13015 [Colletotrichum tanaceti]
MPPPPTFHYAKEIQICFSFMTRQTFHGPAPTSAGTASLWSQTCCSSTDPDGREHVAEPLVQEGLLAPVRHAGADDGHGPAQARVDAHAGVQLREVREGAADGRLHRCRVHAVVVGGVVVGVGVGVAVAAAVAAAVIAVGAVVGVIVVHAVVVALVPRERVQRRVEIQQQSLLIDVAGQRDVPAHRRVGLPVLDLAEQLGEEDEVVGRGLPPPPPPPMLLPMLLPMLMPMLMPLPYSPYGPYHGVALALALVVVVVAVVPHHAAAQVEDGGDQQDQVQPAAAQAADVRGRHELGGEQQQVVAEEELVAQPGVDGDHADRRRVEVVLGQEVLERLVQERVGGREEREDQGLRRHEVVEDRAVDVALGRLQGSICRDMAFNRTHLDKTENQGADAQDQRLLAVLAAHKGRDVLLEEAQRLIIVLGRDPVRRRRERLGGAVDGALGEEEVQDQVAAEGQRDELHREGVLRRRPWLSSSSESSSWLPPSRLMALGGGGGGARKLLASDTLRSSGEEEEEEEEEEDAIGTTVSSSSPSPSLPSMVVKGR